MSFLSLRTHCRGLDKSPNDIGVRQHSILASINSSLIPTIFGIQFTRNQYVRLPVNRFFRSKSTVSEPRIQTSRHNRKISQTVDPPLVIRPRACNRILRINVFKTYAWEIVDLNLSSPWSPVVFDFSEEISSRRTFTNRRHAKSSCEAPIIRRKPYHAGSCCSETPILPKSSRKIVKKSLKSTAFQSSDNHMAHIKRHQICQECPLVVQISHLVCAQ
jgi:hypothetical protein